MSILDCQTINQRLDFLNRGKYELPTIAPFHLYDVTKAVNAAFYMVLQIPGAPLYKAFSLIINFEERNEKFPLTVHVKGGIHGLGNIVEVERCNGGQFVFASVQEIQSLIDCFVQQEVSDSRHDVSDLFH